MTSIRAVWVGRVRDRKPLRYGVNGVPSWSQCGRMGGSFSRKRLVSGITVDWETGVRTLHASINGTEPRLNNSLISLKQKEGRGLFYPPTISSEKTVLF